MNKKTKVIIVAVFAVLVVAAGIIAFLMKAKGSAGTKKFTLTITSERDGFNETINAKSSEEFLGQYLRTVDGLVYSESEYGIYVQGYRDMLEDIDNQYWWRLDVNGQASMTGADEVPLTDGDSYALVLVQGW
ncbi:MAG: DUF4430 domain-containing protein [Lachnospiraceae bacterium]|nr:DUF4430 domain-containing protein [Lachnospiraceae bacterium]